MSKKARKSEIFSDMVQYLGQRFSELPDCRKGDNTFIEMKEVGLSAFSVFFNQYPSFLEHQRAMQRRCSKNNARSLFSIEHIPSDNHIRHLLDPVPPSEIFPVFDYALTQIKEEGLLNDFRWLSNQLLMAVDGLHYFTSKQISCESCSCKHHRDGSITYSHSMVSATLVHPQRSEVLPLPPEFIEPQEGHDKQDCEREALKRWLDVRGNHYSLLGVTLLGDDLYACQPICEKALEKKFHYIFTCQMESHQCLYEWIDSLEKGGGISRFESVVREKNKKYRYCCRYVNQVPLRDGDDALNVNWCGIEVYNEPGERVYSGAFITDHVITTDNGVAISQAGRTRWKTENEHNNTLKNHGYHLEHNFGHGQQHLASLLATLILLSFLFHTALMLLDRRYQLIRSDLPRQMFFQQLRTLLFYMYFATWNALMECMLQACELKIENSS
jgi:hypothetical protein